MKRIATTVLVGVAALALAVAQGQGGGGRGQGQGRGMGMGPGMGGDPIGLNLLRRDDVAKDLALTGEQRSKIDKISQAYNEEIAAMRGPGGPAGGGPAGGGPAGGGGGQGGNRGGQGGPANPQAQADRQAMAENYKKQVAEVLTAEQAIRFKQIRIQVMGANALLDAEVQKELGLSDGQKQAIRKAQQDQMEAMRRQVEEMRNGGQLDREKMTSMRDEATKKAEADMLAVLKPEQMSKFETMKGKKFEMDPNQGPNRGGGRGGRGGGGGIG